MTSREQIEELLLHRAEALMRGDLQHLTRHCTEDYVLFWGDAPPLLGREAVREMYGSMLLEGVFSLTYELEDLRIDGALATVCMRELLILRPRDATVLEHFALRRLSVLQHENGRWQFVRSMVHLQALETI